MKNVTNKYVIFKLHNEFYGIGIENVETIEKIMPITRVPKTEKYIKGVINLRGEIVPVIDLRERFNIDKPENSSDRRIIINRVEDIMVGFIVDSASEVKDILNENIDTNVVSENFDSGFVKGIAKDEDRVIILVEVDKILGVVN